MTSKVTTIILPVPAKCGGDKIEVDKMPGKPYQSKLSLRPPAKGVTLASTTGLLINLALCATAFTQAVHHCVHTIIVTRTQRRAHAIHQNF